MDARTGVPVRVWWRIEAQDYYWRQSSPPIARSHEDSGAKFQMAICDTLRGMSNLHSTHRWQKLRAQIRRRDPICVTCAAAGRTSPTVEIDHITPIAECDDESGYWNPENLQGLCAECHADKSHQEHRSRMRIRARQEKYGVWGCDADGRPLRDD